MFALSRDRRLLTCCNVKGKKKKRRNTKHQNKTAKHNHPARLLQRQCCFPHAGPGLLPPESPTSPLTPPAAGGGGGERRFSCSTSPQELKFQGIRSVSDLVMSIPTRSVTFRRGFALHSLVRGIRCSRLLNSCVFLRRQSLTAPNAPPATSQLFHPHIRLFAHAKPGGLRAANPALERHRARPALLQLRTRDKHESTLGLPSDKAILQHHCPQQHRGNPTTSPGAGEPREGEADIPPNIFPATVYRENPAEPALPALTPPPAPPPQQETHAQTEKTARAKSPRRMEVTEPPAPQAEPPSPSPARTLAPYTAAKRAFQFSFSNPNTNCSSQWRCQLFSPGITNLFLGTR